MPSSRKTADLAACLSSCSSAPACRSVTYYPSGFCSHFVTHCTKTVPSVGAKSYTIVGDPTSSIGGSKHLGEQCSEGAMASPGHVFHMDFCLELCAQSNECNSITYASNGYCYHYTSNCNKRTSMSGAVSFQVNPFSTNADFEMTSCDKNCDQDHSKYLAQTSGFVLTLKDCLESCSRNDDCESTTYYYDGFCSQFGKSTTQQSQKMRSVCHKKK